MSELENVETTNVVAEPEAAGAEPGQGVVEDSATAGPADDDTAA